MAMETDVSFLGSSMDLHMDAAFSDFTTQAGLIDPRPHPAFDQTLLGKPSPGTPSQFLLTPSSLWDRPAFDDSAMDIFADFPEDPETSVDQLPPLEPAAAPEQTREQAPNQVPEVVVEPIKMKEESPAPASIPQVTRRLTRATSSGSQATRSSLRQDRLGTGPSTESSKVKKPRTTSKRTAKRAKGQAKDKHAPREEDHEDNTEQTEATAPSGDQPVGEESVRRNKFLERNRVAASKCRQKKKEWMHDLEERKNELERTHASLLETMNGLVAELSVMKEHLMMHAQCGDPNIDQWFAAEARKFVESKTREDEAAGPASSSDSGVTQHSGRSSVVGFSPTSSIAPPTMPSPQVKEETFSYDYMPDNMFVDDKV